MEETQPVDFDSEKTKLKLVESKLRTTPKPFSIESIIGSNKRKNLDNKINDVENGQTDNNNTKIEDDLEFQPLTSVSSCLPSEYK